MFAEVMASSDRFGHRQHVHLTWLAVRRHGVPAAAELVAEGIARTATAAGAPQKYHATTTRAWVELVGRAAGAADVTGFDTFADRHPDLLDKDLLSRYYRPETLASGKETWVQPDLAPFPGQSETA